MDIICISCGKVQTRTDIIVELNGQAYIQLDEKRMCPKCHKLEDHIATENVTILRKALANSKFSKKIDGYVRG